MVAGLAPDSWRARPAPAEWAPVEIVCHLRDEEAEDFGARVRVILDGGDRFAPIDPERWAVARRYREADPGAALAAFRRLRAANLALLADARVEDLARSVAAARRACRSPGSTSSPRGSPTTGCTSASWWARWRACGPTAGRSTARPTPARSPTGSGLDFQTIAVWNPS